MAKAANEDQFVAPTSVNRTTDAHGNFADHDYTGKFRTSDFQTYGVDSGSLQVDPFKDSRTGNLYQVPGQGVQEQFQGSNYIGPVSATPQQAQPAAAPQITLN